MPPCRCRHRHILPWECLLYRLGSTSWVNVGSDTQIACTPTTRRAGLKTSSQGFTGLCNCRQRLTGHRGGLHTALLPVSIYKENLYDSSYITVHTTRGFTNDPVRLYKQKFCLYEAEMSCISLHEACGVGLGVSEIELWHAIVHAVYLCFGSGVP